MAPSTSSNPMPLITCGSEVLGPPHTGRGEVLLDWVSLAAPAKKEDER